MDFTETWQAALGELELTLSKANFTTWFKNTFISSTEDGKVVVCVPNTFTKAWLEKKYHDAVVRALRNVTNNTIREVCYKVEVKNTTLIPNFQREEPATSADFRDSASFQQERAPTSDSPTETGLNPRYTFESFVVGKANEMAHAAAIAVATKPGENYNPLFIYGGSGLGKTHLLHAIGRHIKATNPTSRILYVTSETFTNQFIQAIRGGQGKDFMEAYRNVDVLLVDDIQFISGKESTQGEFFHTFNALHQANKQIVLTSDRSPKDIQALESRLITRFEWGMITDVSSPDFETRVAILEAKTREKGMTLGNEVLRYIAGTIQSNVRELEGALNKILAYHQFKNIAPTLESVQAHLQSYLPSVPKRTVTPRRLMDIVTGYFDITHEELLGKSREQRLAHPRQIVMYLLRHEAKCSFPAIGEQVGGRDHTTAMHACTKIADLLKRDDLVKRDLSVIREKLYSAGNSG
ncbi:chromosomal replication initiator protein DnaA [Patescibacteria group bacterium]|nr:chromosomal replication initiator protein DnaA [Patescibacteria group bacterium]MBU1448693.1 chromosomal replication initiator protein DnaA [Patescibacteria group bacterium]MBU2613336.1 chromosomal replication initiator protein DnaA [Patescibacteria group bacterium]